MAKSRIRKLVETAFAAALFILAVRLLWREIANTSWNEFVAGLTGVPPIYLCIAAFLIALNYILFVAYDLLALRYLRRALPLRRVALVSFLGYALGNNLGFLLAGTPIRFRFYTRWGLKPRQIIVLISMLGLTFWSGMWFLGGTVLSLVPLPLPDDIKLPFSTRVIGFLLLSLAIGYSIVCMVWQKPWPIGELHLQPPLPSLMTVQACVGAVDLLISATALYLVLPADANVAYELVLAAYLVAMSSAVISLIPGGLGILELILITLLKDSLGDAVVASVLIFRVLYYILPLLAGMTVLVGHEIYGGALEARQARRDSDLS